MKNKIFLLGICLLFTLNTVQAGGTVIKSSSTNLEEASCVKNERGCPVNKNEICTNDSDLSAPNEALRFKRYIKHLEEERATVYNALNLTDEQIKKREELMQENAPIYEEKFDCLLKESFKLKALKTANVGERELIKQRQIVKSIKCDIEDILDKENRCFKKILNRQQRSKYAMIKKLERRDFKREANRKDYYKSNPQMRPFGNPVPYSCPIGREEN